MHIDTNIIGWKNKTNILDLSVPKELERTIKTGIKWFDDAVGGSGLTPSTCAILTGTPGAGKTTLAMQLADAITGAGHVALFNTGEESLYQVRKVTKRIKIKNGFVAGQDRQVKKLLAHANSLMRDAKGKKGRDGNPQQVFVITDSLQTLDDGKYKNGTNSKTPVRAINMLASWCKKTYGIAICIGQVNKDGKIAGKNEIKHAVDMHAHMYVDMEKRSETWGEHLFEIEKNRFGCTGKTYILGLRAEGIYEKGSYSLPGFE